MQTTSIQQIKVKLRAGQSKSTLAGWIKRNGFDSVAFVLIPIMSDHHAVIQLRGVSERQKSEFLFVLSKSDYQVLQLFA